MASREVDRGAAPDDCDTDLAPLVGRASGGSICPAKSNRNTEKERVRARTIEDEHGRPSCVGHRVKMSCVNVRLGAPRAAATRWSTCFIIRTSTYTGFYAAVSLHVLRNYTHHQQPNFARSTAGPVAIRIYDQTRV